MVSQTDAAGVETVPRPRRGDRKCAVGRGWGGHENATGSCRREQEAHCCNEPIFMRRVRRSRGPAVHSSIHYASGTGPHSRDSSDGVCVPVLDGGVRHWETFLVLRVVTFRDTAH